MLSSFLLLKGCVSLSNITLNVVELGCFKFQILWEGHTNLKNISYFVLTVYQVILWPPHNIWTLTKNSAISIFHILMLADTKKQFLKFIWKSCLKMSMGKMLVHFWFWELAFLFWNIIRQNRFLPLCLYFFISKPMTNLLFLKIH